MPDFTTIVSNTLSEVQMIAGDQQTFFYDIFNSDGAPIDLRYGECNVVIFRYGDPNYIFYTLSGTVIENEGFYNRFYVTFDGTNLSGVFQHQIRIIDAHGIEHIPAQGKLVIFPSPPTIV